MNSLRAAVSPALASLALFLACPAAFARLHYICYESETAYKFDHNGRPAYVQNGIFGCAIDGGGSCSVHPLDAPDEFIERPLDYRVQSPGTFRFFDFKTFGGRYTVLFRYFDLNQQAVGEHTCTVQTDRRGEGSYNADGEWKPVLIGFTTDESGLVTTGVWRGQRQPQYNGLPTSASLRLSRNFVAVSGGVWTGIPRNAGIQRMSQFGRSGYFPFAWHIETDVPTNPNTYIPVPFAIGLRIQGLSSADLLAQMQVHRAGTTVPTAHPAFELPAPAGGQVVIGGGASAGTENFHDVNGPLVRGGQFLTQSAPVIGQQWVCDGIGACAPRLETVVTGWRAESKDHVVSAPGVVRLEFLTLPRDIAIGGVTYGVRGKVISATSAVHPTPLAIVGGLRGEFALTGIGATADWRRFDQSGNQTAAGSLLYKVVPRPDIGGADVASTEHTIGSPASVTAYALGIKLVPRFVLQIRP